MNRKVGDTPKLVDVHCHVGLVGDEWPHWGGMSEWYRRQIVFGIFLLYVRMSPGTVSDRSLRDATEKAIAGSRLDHIVCLALDPVYDEKGDRQERRSHLWVNNDYVLDLQRSLGEKVLLGASVHPYDPHFKGRVQKYVDRGAVVLKWLPSAQQIDLADERVREALVYLATAKHGVPLPLLLHVGPEHPMSSDPRTSSYDYLSWTVWDRLRNVFRGSRRWHTPRTRRIRESLRAGLGEGAVIIFAHCGLPYFAPSWLERVIEHSDFGTVSRYLRDYPADASAGGRCYADVSACVTPFRRNYFTAIGKLPPAGLLFGSDFPCPVFELSADLGEMVEDLKAVFKGEWERIVVPQDNLIDVNLRELEHHFPGHPMFSNFSALL